MRGSSFSLAMRERTNDAATRSVWGSISFMGRTIAQMVRGGERATAQVAKLDRALRTASCRNPANDRPTRSFRPCDRTRQDRLRLRSEEHTSELQSLMRISYAVFCLKKKTPITDTRSNST